MSMLCPSYDVLLILSSRKPPFPHRDDLKLSTSWSRRQKLGALVRRKKLVHFGEDAMNGLSDSCMHKLE
jgi:hypothetical protein